jgi:maltokinase
MTGEGRDASPDGDVLARIERARWYRDRGRRVLRLETLARWGVAPGPTLGLLHLDFEDRGVRELLVCEEGDERLAESLTALWGEPRLCSAGDFGLVPKWTSTSVVGLRDGVLQPSDQTNQIVVYPGGALLKFHPVVEWGNVREVRLLAALRHTVAADLVPRLLGHIELHCSGQEEATVGLLLQTWPHESDAYSWLTKSASLEQAAGLAVRIGEALARIHAALAALPAVDGPQFTPSLRGELQTLEVSVEDALRQSGRSMDAERFVGARQARQSVAQALSREGQERWTITTHGDLHLGQILVRGGQLLFIDFEGEPGIPPREREILRHPASDLAGMLRSFHYAAASIEQGSAWALARGWSQAFLSAYNSEGARLLLPWAPISPEDPWILGYALRKALYEARYELGSRPEMARIPLEALCAPLELLNHD